MSAAPRRRRAAAPAADPWTARARPMFLYVMYVMFGAALPIGLLSALSPEIGARISQGMTAYLAAIPDELYAVFATGYLGYTAARQWGKVKGVER